MPHAAWPCCPSLAFDTWHINSMRSMLPEQAPWWWTLALRPEATASTQCQVGGAMTVVWPELACFDDAGLWPIGPRCLL